MGAPAEYKIHAVIDTRHATRTVWVVTPHASVELGELSDLMLVVMLNAGVDWEALHATHPELWPPKTNARETIPRALIPSTG